MPPRQDQDLANTP